ncbi:site-specific integrase [Dysgonomonas sp. GY617]|uniref:site-specific integrase n=1 Tax=Dysgonomonas sp. GY617 TaxID=2780420 RepID=UPI001883A6E5|nr:site-specific integrase [Dysgonomonas sp. GY617]MBF0577750.1 tyrosine-type recombinase/integrase [Dysgonomonas sp. GY617]
MKVGFYLDNAKKDTSALRAIVRNKGQRYTFSIGESVITKYWNENKYRCRTSREYPEASHINIRLDDWVNLIEEAINSFGLIIPTQKMVRDKVDRIFRNRSIEAGGVIENEDQQYLVSFALKYKEESNKSHNTKKSYQTTINKLIEFEKANKIKLRFIDIDIDFYNRFNNWLLNSTYTKGEDEINYTKNYIGTVFKNISKFMTVSQGKEHEFTGHKDAEFKVQSEETDSIYLTQEEIQRIYDLVITEDLLKINEYKNKNLKVTIKSLNEERDRFLFGCFTALRHSDYSRLDALHFKDDIVRIWTQKKDKKVYIPMHHQLRELLKRRNNILPLPISDQKHNKQIKAIGKLAGINEDVILAKTRGGKRVEVVKKKWEFITTHTARRSGATNMYLAGIDLKFIQDILGHSKVEQTIKYIKVTAEDNAKRLINHPYFSGK